MFFAVGITGAAGIWAFVTMLKQLYFICQPSEVLIFAGLSRTRDGRKVGYHRAWWQCLAHSSVGRRNASRPKQYDH